jgi:hypothetical protein
MASSFAAGSSFSASLFNEFSIGGIWFFGVGASRIAISMKQVPEMMG